MSIPNAVNILLSRLQNTPSPDGMGGIVTEVVPKSSDLAENTVISVLMHDVLGRMQVLVPANCLLDVDGLNSKIGRELQALSPNDEASVRAKLSLAYLPAIPEITGFPCVVDHRVSSMMNVYVEAGDGENLVWFKNGSFAQLLKKAREEQFSILIEDISANACDLEDDVVQITQAIKKFTYLRIKQRLDDTLELPPLPETAQKIIHLRADPEAGINELTDVVETDPSLSAQVVSWASSSFYAAPGKVKSVHDAIMRVLGFDLVMNLSMGLALGKTLQQPKESPKGFLDYWQQSVWMATASGALVNTIPRDLRPGFGLTYLSGLLHNLGYLVLAHVFPPHFSLICRYLEANRHVDNSYIEHYLLGITREQMGSRLMHIWNLPEEVVIALRHQKSSQYRGINSNYSGILYVARNLLAERGIPLGAAQPIADDLYDHLGLDPDKASEVIDDLIAAKDEILMMAGMLDPNG